VPAFRAARLARAPDGILDAGVDAVGGVDVGVLPSQSFVAGGRLVTAGSTANDYSLAELIRFRGADGGRRWATFGGDQSSYLALQATAGDVTR
jgi:hypothetical protein